MKRIGFYIDNLYKGGAQRVIYTLVEWLEKNTDKYKIYLITDFKESDKRAHYSFEKTSSIKRIYLKEELSGNPVIKNIKRIHRLKKELILNKIDLVISFLCGPNIRMILATSHLKVIKIASVRNDPNKEYGSSFVSKLFAGILFKKLDGCVFQTPEAMNYFPEEVRAKSRIILNPVNKRFYSVDWDESSNGIIAVGRLEKQKNYNLLIEAYSLIAKEFPFDDLYIFGEGKLRSFLENTCKERGVRNRVHFMGNSDSIEQQLAHFALFVLSSDFEGLPNVLMEAMAVGVPCISTDCPCGGPKSLILNSSQGLLVPCGDVDSLAAYMKNVLNDKSLRVKLGINAKERARNFSSEIICTHWEDYINYLLKETPR